MNVVKPKEQELALLGIVCHARGYTHRFKPICEHIQRMRRIFFLEVESRS